MGGSPPALISGLVCEAADVALISDLVYEAAEVSPLPAGRLLPAVVVKVGGTEYVADGWADHVASVREYGGGGEAARYPGRSRVCVDDAIFSLINGVDGAEQPFRHARNTLADALETYEDAQVRRFETDGVAVFPSFAASSIRDIAPDTDDVEMLKSLVTSLQDLMSQTPGRDVGDVGDVGDVDKNPNEIVDPEPPLPPPAVPPVDAADSAALRRLEKRVLPAARALEKYRAEVALLMVAVSQNLPHLS